MNQNTCMSVYPYRQVFINDCYGNAAFEILRNRIYICMEFSESFIFINRYENLHDSANFAESFFTG
jgi:hypothetical protein